MKKKFMLGLTVLTLILAALACKPPWGPDPEPEPEEPDPTPTFTQEEPDPDPDEDVEATTRLASNDSTDPKNTSM